MSLRRSKRRENPNKASTIQEAGKISGARSICGWGEVVPTKLKTIDFTGEMILLGTGTSVGVPAIGCGCDVCQSGDPKNNRTRCSVILGLPQGNLLIDTSPDLRAQLLREGIGVLHAVLYTHEHVDHLYGLDDLRLIPFAIGGAVPLYCEPVVEQRIRHAFDYAFATRPQTHAGAVPQLELRTIGLEPFEVLGTKIQPIRLQHGPHFQVLGFRFGTWLTVPTPTLFRRIVAVLGRARRSDSGRLAL